MMDPTSDSDESDSLPSGSDDSDTDSDSEVPMTPVVDDKRLHSLPSTA